MGKYRLPIITAILALLISGPPDTLTAAQLVGHQTAMTIAERWQGSFNNINAEFKKTPLREAIVELAEQANLTMAYSESVLKEEKDRRITLSIEGKSFYEAIEMVLDSTTLAYTVTPRRDLIIYQDELSQDDFQTRSVTGVVIDAQNGEPMPGVNVVIQGTTRGTATGAEGRYRLMIPDNPETVLVFSFLGYATQEITVADRDTINVQMSPDVAILEDIVVTGLFERSEQTYTGSAVTVLQEDLQSVDNDNLLSTLQVLDPSFQLNENISLGSDPNALPEVVLRGGNSLEDISSDGAVGDVFNYTSDPNVPLFILNGFEVSLQRVNDLDMNRIKSVTILKDATATTLYGSRAANGIVVIETITPEEGEFRISYNSSLTVESPDLSSYDLLDAEQKLEIEQAGGIYNSDFPYAREELNYLYNQRLASLQGGVDTDWLSIPLRNSIGTQQSLYIDGGIADAVQYGLGFNYQNQSGVMKGSGRENISANTSLSYRVSDFRFQNEFVISFNNGTNSPYGSFRDYARMNPYWAPYTASGNVKYYLENVTSPNDGEVFNTQINPIYNTTLNTVNETSYKNFSNNFFAEWRGMDWLRITARFTYELQNDESDDFRPAQHTDFAEIPLDRFYERGEYIKGYGRTDRLDGSLIAHLNRAFGDHALYGSLGMNILQDKFSQESFTVQGFPNENLDQLLAGNRFPEDGSPTGSESISRTVGYFANVSYAYDNRYLADLSYRLDGSSQFGSNKRFAPFWSIGAGWNVHNESFADDMEWLNRLKLRYSLGYTGSQNFPSYMGITTSQYYTDQDYRFNLGTFLLGYGNENLAWQQTRKNNFGVDLVLFDRLDISADYFIETTEGSVIGVTTPPSVGFDSYRENVGDVINKGWELRTRYTVLQQRQSRDQISVFFNAFHVNGTIERISNALEELNEQNAETPDTSPLPRYVEGRSTTAIWAVPSLGIDPSNGREIYLTRDGELTNEYDPRDQIVAGDSRPDVEGSFGTNLEHRGVGLNLFFRFRYGGQTYNQTLVNRVEEADLNFNVDQRVFDDRWREPGDETFFKGVVDPSGYAIDAPTYASTRFVQDYNWVNLESLSVYYRFSPEFNRKLGLQNTKITLFTGDVFWLSSVKRERGLDYPFARSFTLQLQTSF